MGHLPVHESGRNQEKAGGGTGPEARGRGQGGLGQDTGWRKHTLGPPVPSEEVDLPYGCEKSAQALQGKVAIRGGDRDEVRPEDQGGTAPAQV